MAVNSRQLHMPSTVRVQLKWERERPREREDYDVQIIQPFFVFIHLFITNRIQYYIYMLMWWKYKY